MISYLVEFALLHLLFYGIYKVLLARETQLGFLRFFLIGSTLISLILPLIEIPTQADLPDLGLEAIMLPTISTVQQDQPTNFPWYLILIGVVSFIFIFKLSMTLVQIFGWYKQSEKDSFENLKIRKVAGLQNSFTFFHWIFIDPTNFENPGDIVRHEHGHVKKLHSLDLLFFYILTVCFWWLPSIWLMIKELRIVHEFEADEYALRINDKTYTKTLVHCTLKAHGMNLASSFDDAPIFKRLNFMKKMKKKISIWKMASIAALVIVSGIMFACEESADQDSLVEGSSEIQTDQLGIVNTDGIALSEFGEPASFPGGLEAYGSFLSENLKYPKQARKMGIEGRVFVQFIVETDGSISNVEVVKGIGAGCDDEAVRVIKEFPKWNPAKKDGKLVQQKFIQNILFKLPKEEAE